MWREGVGSSGGEVCQHVVANREVQLDALHNHLQDCVVPGVVMVEWALVQYMSQCLSPTTQPACNH